MNTEKFTGKAQAYADARPGYPVEAMEYIRSLAPPDAVFADIGAGTGKFTELLAKFGNEVYAVEPNADMRGQLTMTLAPFTNAKIIVGVAEATTLPDNCVDAITCAQAIGWFDLDAFRAECLRIGKPGATVISLYNDLPGDDFVPSPDENRRTSKRATEIFFRNPVVREFPNPIFYSREMWLQSAISVSDNPRPFDPGYDAFIAETNAVFDRDNVGGLICQRYITRIFYETL